MALELRKYVNNAELIDLDDFWIGQTTRQTKTTSYDKSKQWKWINLKRDKRRRV